MFVIGWNDGHTLTGIGTGAVGIIKETDRNRRIGAKARSILSSEYEDVRVVNCTIDKSSNDMADAVKIANDNNCNVFISNHVNAGGGYGFEGFYSRYNKADGISRGKIIYDKLCNTKSCLMARRYCSDYSYKKYDLYVLVNTKMDAFLFEIGFVDNQKCVNAVNDDEVARAYAEGIASAYGLKKKSSSTTSGSSFTVGDVVQVTGSVWVTGQTIPTWVKSNQYKIKQINGSKLLLDPVNSWINSNDVKKINNGGSYHTVISGDTLWGISQKYGVTVDHIKNINNLSSNIINVGQVLKIK